jgi:hypothetical protein
MRAIAACAVLLLFLSCTSAESRDNVMFSMPAGECTLSVESNDRWYTLRLRAHHPSGNNCFIDRETVASVLGAALSKADAQEAGGKFSSLYIGRLVDYPWLSQALAVAARNDRGWDAKKGKPTRMNINLYVSKLLSSKDITEPFDAALAKGGYKVKGVSAEKVLVGRLRNVPLCEDDTASGLVPYDAQVWFRLENE